MKRILVWDLPVRLFHWLFAGAFLGAFIIAQTVDDESTAFTLHMLLGGVMVFMVVLRLIWGFVGSRYARFSSFTFSPAAVLGYFKRALSGGATRHTGHNPGTAIAVFAMFALAIGLGITGAFMGAGGEVFEEVHEVLAWAFVVVVGAHIAGIIWHTIRHRENIALSMIDGKKEAEPTAAITRRHGAVALVFLVLTGLWTTGLIRGWDASTHTLTLPITGQSIAIGEGEEHEEHGEAGEHDEEEDDD